MCKRYRLVLLAIAAAVIGGCGGGGRAGSSMPGARLVIRVEWPSRNRLVPKAANSVKVEVRNSAGFDSSRVLERPAAGQPLVTAATFETVPVGTLSVTATAYPQPAAGGEAQATGSASVDTRSGQTADVSVSMASTIHHLDLGRTDGEVGVGHTLQLAASARNTAGAVVLVATGNIVWASSDPALATVDATGKVRGVAGGQVQITATETESGKAVALQVRVVVYAVVRPGVNVLPDDGSVAITALTETSVVLSGAVPELRPGSVIVSGEGEGLLRRVRSVTRRRDGASLETEQATLEDVFEEAHIQMRVPLSLADLQSVEGGVPGFTLASRSRDTLGELPLSASLEGVSLGPITLAGAADVRVGLEFDVDIAGSSTTRCRFLARASGDVRGTITAILDGDADAVRCRFHRINFAPKTFLVPAWPIPIPVVLIPKLDLLATANRSTGIAVTFQRGFTASAGAEYSGGETRLIGDSQMTPSTEPTVTVQVGC